MGNAGWTCMNRSDWTDMDKLIDTAKMDLPDLPDLPAQPDRPGTGCRIATRDYRLKPPSTMSVWPVI